MFDRLSGESHQALEEARAEAGQLGHDFVGTEHLLLGVLDVGDEIAGTLLASKGVLSEKVRAQVARAGALQQPPLGLPPLSLTARAKQVMALAAREADDLGSTSVAPVHLLLGIIRQETGVAALVLQDLGVDLVALRDELLTAMTGRPDGDGEGRRSRDGREDEAGGAYGTASSDVGGASDGDPATGRRLAAPVCPRCERPLADHLVVSEMSPQNPPTVEPSQSRLPKRGGRSAAVVVVSCGACGYPLSISR